jgi:hypothetical protein
MAAHDDTIAVLLSAMNMQQNHIPFAASIFFEVWNRNGTNLVKMIYEGKELDL